MPKKGQKLTPEQRAKEVAKLNSEHAIERRRAGVAAYWTPERRAAWAENVRRRRANNPQWTENQRKAIRSHFQSMTPEDFDGHLRRLKAGRQQWWNSLSREEQLAVNTKARQCAYRDRQPTNIENLVELFLNDLGLAFRPQWSIFLDSQQTILAYVADFYIPANDLVVECDGLYWHRQRDPDRERERDQQLSRMGYQLVRLSDSEILSRDFGKLESALQRS